MSPTHIQLLQHELLLRGINMNVPPSVYHMDYDKALSVCTSMHAGLTFRQAIGAYDKDIM